MSSLPRIFPNLVPDPQAKLPLFQRDCPEMIRLLDQVQRIAPQNTSVLISGETGTGKSRLARLIHELSPRRDQPFLVVNCGALAAGLIESELFGHVRGAFTGAVGAREGRLAEAGSGTLMLDDIDGLPPALQIKLLRAVEERIFEAVGANQSHSLQARLVAASNRDLKEEVAAGRFREDLYYRLNVVELHLPPLRQRRNIIAPLAREFLAKFAADNGRRVHHIAERALCALEAYDWPGNIRELRNVIERAVALCPGQEVRLRDLPDYIYQPQKEPALAFPVRATPSATQAAPPHRIQTVEESEAACIHEALRRHKYNRLRAAKELGISRVTLYTKIRKYGLA
jgi:two-component system NtrC family response regulator/two-component system response regulator AtoC